MLAPCRRGASRRVNMGVLEWLYGPRGLSGPGESGKASVAGSMISGCGRRWVRLFSVPVLHGGASVFQPSAAGLNSLVFFAGNEWVVCGGTLGRRRCSLPLWLAVRLWFLFGVLEAIPCSISYLSVTTLRENTAVLHIKPWCVVPRDRMRGQHDWLSNHVCRRFVTNLCWQ